MPGRSRFRPSTHCPISARWLRRAGPAPKARRLVAASCRERTRWLARQYQRRFLTDERSRHYGDSRTDTLASLFSRPGSDVRRWKEPNAFAISWVRVLAVSALFSILADIKHTLGRRLLRGLGMGARSSICLLAGTAAVVFAVALATAWWRQSNVESLDSITVKLPTAQRVAKPGFR